MSHQPIAHPGAVPVGSLDRRFYAFFIDCLIGWGVVAAGGWAAYVLFFGQDQWWRGAMAVAAVLVVVWLAFSVAVGVWATTPGKAAVGLRLVHYGTGTPIGVGRALLRSLVLGLATVPTFGIGLATLAWTAVSDPGHRRRGWHDQVAGSIVVDVRPEPVAVVEADRGPRHVVNLTAMRLMPAPQSPVPAAPARAPRPVPAPVPTPARTPAPVAGPEPDAETSRTARRPPVEAPSGASAGWLLSFDTGERVAVDGLVLLGRRPEARPGEPVRHLVALPSPDMSLSKTHAQVLVAGDGALVVMDRGSTNGSVLVRRGVSRPLSGGKPATLLAGDLVHFGDRSMQVFREV